MSRPPIPLVSPRTPVAASPDLGEREALMAGQRVRRGAARRRAGARPGPPAWRRLGLAAAAVVALAAPAAATAWLLGSPRFAVAAVAVEGLDRLPAAAVLEAAAIAPGTSLWRIDPGAVRTRVEALPGVARADVVRHLPDRLTIVVEERRPFALAAAGRLVWVDEEGRVLGEAPAAVAPAVPVISGLDEAAVAPAGAGPVPELRRALAVIRALLRAGSPLTAEISEIVVGSGEGPVLYTVDGVEVRLGAEDWPERLARLEGVLGQVAGRADEVRAIDLRFRDQVILTRGGRG